MPSTRVRGHDRKGTRGVKSHIRSLPNKKKVPHDNRREFTSDELQKIYWEANKRHSDAVTEFHRIYRETGKYPEPINRKEIFKEFKQYQKHLFIQDIHSVHKGRAEISNIEDRKDYLYTRVKRGTGYSIYVMPYDGGRVKTLLKVKRRTSPYVWGLKGEPFKNLQLMKNYGYR